MNITQLGFTALRLAVMLALALGLASEASAQLRVGAARVEITPPLLPGMQGPTGKFAHEHLFARAIVVDNGTTRAALIANDQSDLPNEVWQLAAEQVAKAINAPLANVLMSATHTHSAGAPLGPGTPEEQKRVADGILRAVREANGKLQPARMAFDTGMANLNVNRDAIDPATHLWTQGPNPLGASDKTVAVLKFETPQGRPLAVYVNYAMHPINAYLANFTTADFAGAMSRHVEMNYGDQPVVIFSQGAAGDQNPLYMHLSTNGLASRSGVPVTGDVMVRESVEAPLRAPGAQGKPMDPVVRERLESWIEAEGQLLGEEVIRVMTNATHSSQQVRIWADQKLVTCPGRTRTDQGREGKAGRYTDGPPVPLHLGVIGIGDVALTHIDAEVYTLIGQRVKRQSPLANTMFVTIANGR